MQFFFDRAFLRDILATMKMYQIAYSTLEHLPEDGASASRSELFDTLLQGIQEIDDDQLVKEALERVMAIESLAELDRLLDKSTLPRA